METTDRFLSKVEKTDSCWNWTAACFNNGYGAFKHNAEQWYAHRYSYTAFVGDLIGGLVVDHLCSNKKCVNPKHLEQVTYQENMVRAYSKRKHCKYGHDLDGIRRKNQIRYCKTCNNQRERERYHKKKANIEGKST